MTTTSEKSGYSDIIASDLLPSASTTETKALFEETYNNTKTALPCDFLNRRQRSVSQSLVLESQQQSDREEGNLDFLYDTKQIGSLLGSLKLSPSRDRAESDFASYTAPRHSLLAVAPTVSKQSTGSSASSQRASVNIKTSKEEDVGKKQGYQNRARKKRKDDWICPACGNRNYAWRNVCNMRKCRAPKPGNLVEPAPPGSWQCIQCGNMNYAERVVCNMRKCRAPRPFASGFVPRYQFPQQQFPVATAYPYTAQFQVAASHHYANPNPYLVEEQPLYAVQNTLEQDMFTDYNVR